MAMLDDVQARIDALSERLRYPTRRKPVPSPRDASKAREARYRLRRATLEAEREAWELLVEECHGCIARIARRMHCDRSTAERALWDLGLWPDVVRERGGL